MGTTEVNYYISHGLLIKEVENAGPRYLRRGPERHESVLCLIEDAKSLYPRELERATVMTDKFVDYAYPCMMTEKALKQLHEAMLRKDYDNAIEHGFKAVAEARLTLVAIKHMKEQKDALRQQTASV